MVEPDTGADPDETGNALGSTEPTAEERCHWMPGVAALAARDGEKPKATGCRDDVEAEG